MEVGAFVAAGRASRLGRRISSATVASTGLALEAGALIILALAVGPATADWLIALILVFYGVGVGLCSAKLTSVILAAVPRLPSPLQPQLDSTLSTSADGIVPQVSNGAIPVPSHTIDAVASALSIAFADATRLTMANGALFLNRSPTHR